MVGTRHVRPGCLPPEVLGELRELLARGGPWLEVFQGAPAPLRALVADLGRMPLEGLERAGLVDVRGSMVSSAFAAHEVQGLWVFTDPLVPQDRRAADYLDPLWEGRTVAGLLIGRRQGSALDMGSGCGVLTLALARDAGTVIGVDINPRAIEVGELNALLNGVQGIAFRHGDLFGPVAGLRFDRIVFNSPTNREGPAFRNLLEAGEGVLARFFHELPGHLAGDGICQVNLGTTDRPDDGFLERLGRWLGSEATSMQAVLLTRESEALPDGGVWKRGWLTLRRRRPHFTVEVSHPYHRLGPEGARDLLVHLLDHPPVGTPS